MRAKKKSDFYAESNPIKDKFSFYKMLSKLNTILNLFKTIYN